MLKRSVTIILGILLVLMIIPIALADNPLDGLVDQIEDAKNKVDNTTEQIQKLSREDVKWQELGDRFQEIILRNKVVSTIDEFLKKINILFVILFGRDYALSLTLLFLIFIWLYFFNQFGKIIGTFSTFSSTTSMIISLGMVIIMAQLKFFDWFSQVLFKLIFYRDGAWGWVWNIAFFFVAIFVGMVFGRFFTSLKKSVRKFREEADRRAALGEDDQRRKMLDVYIDAFKGIFSSKE